jgi:hypothetical protein
MKYQNKTFSVAMPGGTWPLQQAPDFSGEPCGECGKPGGEGYPHLNAKDVEQKRPRKRVCFGRVVSR